MTLRAPIKDWAEWTGLSCPESGQYLPTGAAVPVTVDVEAGEGVYLDPNVWVVHQVG
jgi:hypothetical protein